MGFVPQLPDPDAILRSRRVAERWLDAYLRGDPGPAEAFADPLVVRDVRTGSEFEAASPPSLQALRTSVGDVRHEEISVDLLADGILVCSVTVGTIGGREVRNATWLVARIDRHERIHRFEIHEEPGPVAVLHGRA